MTEIWPARRAVAEAACLLDAAQNHNRLQPAQRGASLRTAAGYEIFVDTAGYAVYALREPGNTAVHLLRVDSPIAAV